MTTESSLTIFSRAAQMLVEADTIQKTKELKDLAFTAADYAQRKGLGEKAVRYARSYGLEAERKMGALLAETERAKGAMGNPGGQGAPLVRLPNVTTQSPTLAELGISKRESSESQQLAALPEETFEVVKAGKKTLHQVKREMLAQKDKERIEYAAAHPEDVPVGKVTSGITAGGFRFKKSITGEWNGLPFLRTDSADPEYDKLKVEEAPFDLSNLLQQQIQYPASELEKGIKKCLSEYGEDLDAAYIVDINKGTAKLPTGLAEELKALMDAVAKFNKYYGEGWHYTRFEGNAAEAINNGVQQSGPVGWTTWGAEA